MKIITLSNEKGGVGKTTMSVHIAAAMAMRGKRVVILDTDAQGNATSSFGIPHQPKFYDLIVRGASWRDSVQIIPPEKYELPTSPSQGFLGIVPGNEESALIQHKIVDANLLRVRLQELRHNVDVVVVDTSPTPSLLHSLIYMATNYILLPTVCESHSVDGLNSTIKKIENAIRNMESQRIEILGIVPNMFRRVTVEHTEILDELQNQYPHIPFFEPVPLEIKWSEAVSLRRLLFTTHPDFPAVHHIFSIVDYIERALHVQTSE